ncbi:glycosyltransferase family 4 protein [Deinococcus budaensis]|uniref:Glycosyltransferase involved in cell wall biosynthesis n=1 Tax=Deinococcus budaensis TaxID=1665626 RepID=A0A7W8GGA6_9DEIO|nr:glycosyltransferase family 4 protein [Deinococcus budaensis]MBB5234809.1 glycosyltransferase involved in cell wall biosynthesis [Deinococcus budaensis]
MRILKLAHSYLPERTGISEVARRLAEGLVQRGHEVHVATSWTPGRPRETVINGVHVHAFELRGNWMQGISGSVAEQERYRALVFDQQWDVRHFHAGRTWTLDLLLDDIVGLSGRKIYTPHGLPDWQTEAWRPYYDKMRQLFFAFDRVVCLSETFEDKPFCESIGLDAVVIPNGVDLSEFEQEPEGMRTKWGLEDRPFLVNVSNHSPPKGHHRLIELARRMPDMQVVGIGNHYPAEKWNLGRLGVKGGCYYRCRQAQRRLENLSWQERMPRAQIVSALREADLFVLTSVREAAPLVILEAMAAGLPWVSFDVGNLRENAGGVIVESVKEMEQTIRALLGDSERRRELGAAGQRQIQERHSWETITDQYEALYAQPSVVPA